MIWDYWNFVRFLFPEMKWSVFLCCGSISKKKGLWLVRLLKFSFSFIPTLTPFPPGFWCLLTEFKNWKSIFPKRLVDMNVLAFINNKWPLSEILVVQNFHNQGTITNKIFSGLVCILTLPQRNREVFIFFLILTKTSTAFDLIFFNTCVMPNIF